MTRSTSCLLVHQSSQVFHPWKYFLLVEFANPYLITNNKMLDVLLKAVNTLFELARIRKYTYKGSLSPFDLVP